jgi:signal transduction histidine kinase
MISSHTAGNDKWRVSREVLISRLVVSVAAACLIAAATAWVVRTPPVELSHPRNWIVAIVFCLLGLRIVAHARRNPVGWLILTMGTCAAVAIGTGAWAVEHWLSWIGTWIWWPGYALLSIISLIFPNGRLLSAWWWPVFALGVLGVLLPMISIGWASWSSPATFWNDALQGTARRGTPVGLGFLGLGCFLLSSLGAVAALLVRWRRAAGNQRPLFIWVAICAGSAVLALILELQLPGTIWEPSVVVAAAFPVAATVAILRYGLYDIGLLVHRTLLYGSLTVALTLAYAAVVRLATAPFPAQARFIGTVAVVLALAPSHRFLRGRVDRWLYGDRADPYQALARLGEQLEKPLPPEELLTHVAATVSAALKVPYVAVALDIDGQSRTLAAHGESHDRPWYRIPMRHGGRDVGELIVESRAPDERFGQRERRLLDDLARQMAPAAHSVRLDHELRRLNDQFEQEREKALRKITRDMHDVIGPSLAGVRLQVDAVRKLAGDDNPRIRQQLGAAIDDLTGLSTNVRNLVSNVVPRDLHLGLLDAVRRQADRFRSPDLEVCVLAEGSLDRLPAGVELEAYRIIGEALTNVAKHANARSCQILLHRETDLRVSITDDGTGIPSDAVIGLGLESMRKRCEDLGGTFEISPLPGRTQIIACLPLGRD